MTPKEKARDLVDKMLYCYQGHIDEYTAKQCAFIAVDEVLKSQNNIYGVNNRATKFYLEVKHELEKL
jgi:UTP-glucose-1-phosphate uridylyltransferase